jgi:hypothetical protein
MSQKKGIQMKIAKTVALTLCVCVLMAHANDDDHYSLNQQSAACGIISGAGLAFTIAGMRRINACIRTLRPTDESRLLESQQQPSETAMKHELSSGLLAVGTGAAMTLIGFVPWIINLYAKVDEKCN